MKKRRLFALLVAATVAFTVFFSMIFPSAQADHAHESGETCAICATIQECNELLRTVAAALSGAEDYRAPAICFIGESERRKRALSSRCVTPVSLKVKLID